ncbi:MAG: ABC transporter permease [Ginsengibacter sp.]
MYKNYFLSVIRNLKKNFFLSFINILGLGIGIATTLVIALFINDEFKYDKFHKQPDSIYRIAMFNGEEFHNPLTPMPLAPLIEKDFTQIRKAVRIYKNRSNSQLISYNEKKFFENGCIYADSTFFDVFSFALLEGNTRTALSQPNTVIITESAAHKYFGSENPVGKTLQIDNTTPTLVTGVMRDVPEHSHMHFDFLFSFTSMSQQHKDNWLIPFMFTYVVIPDKEAAKNIESKLTAFAVEHMNPQIKEALGMTFDEMLKKNKQTYQLYLQPLTDIHLHSNLKVELEPNGNIKNIYIFTTIGILVLIVACINFINLTTVIAGTRLKEISVRKVIGATRKQLIRQFLLESLFFSFLAAIAAIILAIVILPAVNHLLGKQLVLFKSSEILWPLVTVALAVTIGLVSGLYPAFYLSKLNTVKGFRKIIVHNSSLDLRKILVTTQFIISSALIISICIVYQQLHYMQTKDPGFNKEQVITIPVREGMNLSQKVQLKNELLQNPSITNVSMTNYIPGQEAYENQDIFSPEGSNEKIPLWYINTDFDFVNTMQLKLIAGRNFSKELTTDSTAYLINETAVKQLGWTSETAIGKKITAFDSPDKTISKNIIGVIKDFQFENFATPVRPMLIGISTNSWWKYIIKVNPLTISSTLDFLKSKWSIYQPSYPFDYTFLDQYFAVFWRKEKVLASFTAGLTILAIIIACLGLLALSLFLSALRTKEIGIRKVVGASTVDIVTLLSGNILKLIVIGFCVATPIAWFVMNKWLQDFSYRIHVRWGIFFLAAAISIIIALVTIGFQSIKAAMANPVKSLRTE